MTLLGAEIQKEFLIHFYHITTGFTYYMEVLNKCREFIIVFISKKTMKNSESFYILCVTERRQRWHEKAYSITR